MNRYARGLALALAWAAVTCLVLVVMSLVKIQQTLAAILEKMP